MAGAIWSMLFRYETGGQFWTLPPHSQTNFSETAVIPNAVRDLTGVGNDWMNTNTIRARTSVGFLAAIEQALSSRMK